MSEEETREAYIARRVREIAEELNQMIASANQEGVTVKVEVTDLAYISDMPPPSVVSVKVYREF